MSRGYIKYILNTCVTQSAILCIAMKADSANQSGKIAFNQ